MNCNSKTDIFKPPGLGMRLLEVILPPEVADNQLGDLEEEYRARARRRGIKRTWVWFWFQVFSTLVISIREDGFRCIFLERVMRRYWNWAGDFWALADGDRLIRRSFVAIIIIILTLGLILMYLNSPLRTRLEEQLAQMQVAPYWGIQELPEQVNRPEVINTYEIHPRTIYKTASTASARKHARKTPKGGEAPPEIPSSTNFFSPVCGLDSAIEENLKHEQKNQPEKGVASQSTYSTGPRCML